jgi:hypothetical protein
MIFREAIEKAMKDEKQTGFEEVRRGGRKVRIWRFGVRFVVLGE